MIIPKHKSLFSISELAYKKIPKKDLTYNTIKYLARNFPKDLVNIVYDENTTPQDKIIILDVLSSIKNDIFEYVLIDLSTSGLPAIRESACFALSKYISDTSINRLIEVVVSDVNKEIKEITASYLKERN